MVKWYKTKNLYTSLFFFTVPELAAEVIFNIIIVPVVFPDIDVICIFFLISPIWKFI